jgi:C-terminal processing protease CtpA/Prc
MNGSGRFLAIGLLVGAALLVAGTVWAGRTGVGLQVVALPGGELVVVRVVSDSPAERSGFRPGDLLLSINGRALAGSDLAAISQEALWGPSGAKIAIRFLRPGVVGVHEIAVTRAPIGDVPETPVEVQMLQPQPNQLKDNGQ